MPWEGNSGVEATYVSVTWYPQPLEIEDAIAFSYGYASGGIEYDDGAVAQVPFTDVPLGPGRPYVRVYFTEQQYQEVREGIGSYCQRRDWPICVERLHSIDWANAWKAYYGVQRFRQGYVVVPSWEESSPVDETHTLWLDPGMAFGTGTHPTTRMCVNALIGLGSLRGKAVLDLGAGSGILSLVAARLGAEPVVAVEPDPVAVAALRQNIEENQAVAVRVVAGKLSDVPTGRFDVLVLNLIWEIIVDEWERLKSYTGPGSLLLLSGLLSEKREDIIRRAQESGYEVADIFEEQGWLLMAVRT